MQCLLLCQYLMVLMQQKFINRQEKTFPQTTVSQAGLSLEFVSLSGEMLNLDCSAEDEKTT